MKGYVIQIPDIIKLSHFAHLIDYSEIHAVATGCVVGTYAALKQCTGAVHGICAYLGSVSSVVYVGRSFS